MGRGNLSTSTIFTFILSDLYLQIVWKNPNMSPAPSALRNHPFQLRLKPGLPGPNSPANWTWRFQNRGWCLSRCDEELGVRCWFVEPGIVSMISEGDLFISSCRWYKWRSLMIFLGQDMLKTHHLIFSTMIRPSTDSHFAALWFLHVWPHDAGICTQEQNAKSLDRMRHDTSSKNANEHCHWA